MYLDFFSESWWHLVWIQMKSSWRHPIMPAVLSPLKPSLETSKWQLDIQWETPRLGIEFNLCLWLNRLAVLDTWSLARYTCDMPANVPRLCFAFNWAPSQVLRDVKQWTRKTWRVHFLNQKWLQSKEFIRFTHLSYSSFLREAKTGTPDRNWSRGPGGTLHTGLLFIVGWGLPHQLLIRIPVQ